MTPEGQNFLNGVVENYFCKTNNIIEVNLQKFLILYDTSVKAR